MRRRQFSATIFSAGASLLIGRLLAATAEPSTGSVKGKLVQNGEKAPVVLQGEDGHAVTLSGDEDTQKVLHDPRLNGMELEALGHFTAPNQFATDPRFEKNMFVLKDGKRLRITYWCDICSIRTFAPGVCVCCQKWTDLDLRDPNQE